MGLVASLGSSFVRLAVACALTVVAFSVAPIVQARPTANLSLDVTFSPSGVITVTLPDGTPVGTVSGPPTVIPAGYYTIFLNGQLDTTGMPYFNLTGPGVDVLSNMNEGGIANLVDAAYFSPNSTFTWTDDAAPQVVHTLATSAVILGTAPATAISPKSGPPASSQDIVGSDATSVRGTLIGAVTPAGELSLALGGTTATRLAAGRYRIVVTDRSRKRGFVLEKRDAAALSLTGVTFVGTHSRTVDLTAGRWLYQPVAGGRARTLTVG